MRLTTVLPVALGLASIAFGAAPVPRPSPEFAAALPDGKQILLSQYKGKVVLIEFLLTTCPHCQHEAGLLTNIYKDLGPKGFQPIGVAVNKMPAGIAPSIVSDFVRDHSVGFPVGYADPDQMHQYMGTSVMERWVVPQIVLVDRKGVIRFQTPPLGSDDVTKEAWLREKIGELLKEPAASHTTSKKATTGSAARKRTS